MIKFLLKKTVSLALIVSSLWQTFTSLQELLFIFPKISFIGNLAIAQSLYLNLIKKAIVISTGLFIDFFYGFTLFIKPLAATKTLHLILGILILIFSILLFRLPLLPFI